jgi:hypothetical protein
MYDTLLEWSQRALAYYHECYKESKENLARSVKNANFSDFESFIEFDTLIGESHFKRLCHLNVMLINHEKFLKSDGTQGIPQSLTFYHKKFAEWIRGGLDSAGKAGSFNFDMTIMQSPQLPPYTNFLGLSNDPNHVKTTITRLIAESLLKVGEVTEQIVKEIKEILPIFQANVHNGSRIENTLHFAQFRAHRPETLRDYKFDETDRLTVADLKQKHHFEQMNLRLELNLLELTCAMISKAPAEIESLLITRANFLSDLGNLPRWPLQTFT